MTRLVAIVGPMRSGTSLVASIVHHLGYPVGVAITAPIPPLWRSDWEDPALSVPLMRRDKTDVAWFKKYFDYRRRASQAQGFGGTFAIKSPYLALAWDAMWMAAQVMGLEVIDILVTRPRDQITASLLANKALSLNDQAEIQARIDKIQTFDFSVDYDDLISAGSAEVENIANKLEVHDPELIARAYAQIGPRTEYTGWLSQLQR